MQKYDRIRVIKRRYKSARRVIAPYLTEGAMIITINNIIYIKRIATINLFIDSSWPDRRIHKSDYLIKRAQSKLDFTNIWIKYDIKRAQSDISC